MLPTNINIRNPRHQQNHHHHHPSSSTAQKQVRANKRYAGAEGFTIAECAAKVAKDVGKIDILVRMGGRVRSRSYKSGQDHTDL